MKKNKARNSVVLEFLGGIYVPHGKQQEFDKLKKEVENGLGIYDLGQADEGFTFDFLTIQTKGKGTRETYSGCRRWVGRVAQVKRFYLYAFELGEDGAPHMMRRVLCSSHRVLCLGDARRDER